MKPYKRLVKKSDDEGRVIDSNELERIMQNSSGVARYSVYIPHAINSTIYFESPKNFKSMGITWRIGTPTDYIFITKKNVKSIRIYDENFIFLDLKRLEGVIEFEIVR